MSVQDERAARSTWMATMLAAAEDGPRRRHCSTSVTLCVAGRRQRMKPAAPLGRAGARSRSRFQHPSRPRTHGAAARATLAALVLIAGACDAGNGSARKFQSSEYGYSVDLPSGWTSVPASARLEDGEPPTTASGRTDILGGNANTRVSQMRKPGVIVGAQTVAADTTADAWATAATKTIAFMKGCPEPDERFPHTIDHNDAVVLVYEDCPSGSGITHLWATVVHDDLGFHIVWFDDAGDLDEQRTELRAFLASFSFG